MHLTAVARQDLPEIDVKSVRLFFLIVFRLFLISQLQFLHFLIFIIDLCPKFDARLDIILCYRH